MADSHLTSGRFRDNTFVKVLTAAAEKHFSGKILIKAREGFGTVFFRDGRIVSASTPLLRDRIIEKLIKSGVFGRDEVKAADKFKKENPRRHLETMLVEEGYISREDLFTILKEVSEDTLFGMMFWNGMFRMEKITAPSIPDEYLIDVFEFIEKTEVSLDGDFILEVENSFGASDHLFSSGSDSESELDPQSEINRTLKDVARSMTTFRPREVVIIVEDEALIRTILADKLASFKFEVETYDTAKGALERIHSLKADRFSPVVILDLLMTGLYDDKEIYGGMDLLNNISQNYPMIPVIIVTGVHDPDIRLKTQFLGAAYFINKPAAGGAANGRSSQDIKYFIEEISYCLENIFRRQQAFMEKEQLATIREELLNQILRKGKVSFVSIEDVMKAKILIIDDEPDICNLGQEFLQSEGFSNVTTTTDSQEAIRLITDKKYDVVITDIVMPKKNGIELLTYVKTVTPHSQVIIITGYADKNTAVAAVKLGAYDYMEKPLDFSMLSESVKKAAELKLVLDGKI